MNLDRVIQLHSPTQSTNSTGQKLLTYSSEGNFYAALNPTTAREDNSGSQLYGLEVARWAIRYNTDVTYTWRVVHGSDSWQIIGIQHNGRKTYTTLICKLLDNAQ